LEKSKQEITGSVLPEAEPAATVQPSFKKSQEVIGPSVFIVFTVLKKTKKVKLEWHICNRNVDVPYT